jgi:hypothetical protein
MSEPGYVAVNIADDMLPLLPAALCDEIRRLRTENESLRMRIKRIQRGVFSDAELASTFGENARVVEQALG